MIVKREKYYTWYSTKDKGIYFLKSQRRKRTSYWLLGIIPLFIKTEVLGGDYEWRINLMI